jgi:flavorubredoxin
MRVSRILVLYYSRTGNTEKMANAVAEGARTVKDTKVDLEYHVDAEDLGRYDAIIIGTSTYYHDMPMDIKRLFEEAAEKRINLKGKTGAAFGSYGWSGEAPKLVLEIMKYKFEMQVTEPPLLATNTPSQNSLTMCRELGRRVSETLIHKA